MDEEISSGMEQKQAAMSTDAHEETPSVDEENLRNVLDETDSRRMAFNRTTPFAAELIGMCPCRREEVL